MVQVVGYEGVVQMQPLVRAVPGQIKLKNGDLVQVLWTRGTCEVIQEVVQNQQILPTWM